MPLLSASRTWPASTARWCDRSCSKRGPKAWRSRARRWAGRAEFADVFMLSRKFQGTAQISPPTIEETLKFFDDVTEPTAKSVLHYWRRDPHYARAIDEVGEVPKPSEMS